MSKYNPTENWTDDEWNVFTTWLRGVLHNNEVVVTFIKKDGSERVMRCTLDPVVLPQVELKEGATPRKESTTAMRVYDLGISDWRSFTIKSVKNVKFSI